MPYNTRRKSISLAALGVQVPGSAKESARLSHLHQNTNATATATPEQPAAKRTKRSHTLNSDSTSLSSPSSVTPTTSMRHDRRKSGSAAAASRHVANTPPPSPRDTGPIKLDTEGIRDDVVVAVLKLIEQTGNRPHHIKELAAVLTHQLPVVESSANPQAIISSRLTTYLRRPWTALAPCPLGKELVGTHPRRTYFYLTTFPHQPITEPPVTPSAAKPRIITPPLSSASIAEGDEENDESPGLGGRRALSPSPELDLSSPELEDDPSSTSMFSHRTSLGHDSPHSRTHPPTPANISHNRRAQSPPLEKDEREFTATASSIQQRSRSLELERKSPGADHASTTASDEPGSTGALAPQPVGPDEDVDMDSTPHEDPSALFEPADGLHLAPAPMLNPFSSPVMAPLHSLHISSPGPRPPPHMSPATGGMISTLPSHPAATISAKKKHGAPDNAETVRIDGLDHEEVGLDVADVAGMWGWDELKSPEMVELSELDYLFDRY